MHSVKIRPEVLDEIKSAHYITSDAELADRIGISKALLCHVRTGRRGVGTSFIAGMYLELGIPFELDDDGLYEVAA